MTLYDLEYDALDPYLGTVDLNRFEQLPESERMRIIIRVLCGLVAMEDRSVRSVDPPAPDLLVTSPTPGPTTAALPMLGIERNGSHKRRNRPRGWNTALLPFFGHERPY